MKKITILCGMLFLQSAILLAQTATFNYTGSVQTYTVPPCVTSITVDIQGAQGGVGALGCGGYQGLAGLGGRTQATIPVTPGDVLSIYVGGAGMPDNNTSAAGGFNGGGDAMFENTYTYYGGGGGGGASDIRLNGVTLNDRIAVAGGGGGAGSDGCNCNGLDGGHGGGLTGTPGQPGTLCICNPSGQGGTQGAGGVKGDWGCNCNAQPGTLGIGGNSNSTSCGGPTGGGGGGGGYYGGGGGALGAGGGGSNYTIGTASGVTNAVGFRSGNGLVLITPNNGIPNPGSITGSTSICQNASGNYSITSLPGATSYTWTVPVGSVINSGQGTNSINVTFGNTSGNITVTATFPCGTSGPTSLSITVNPAPTVTANSTASSVCAGDMVTLTGGGATSYTWDNSVTNGVPFAPVSTATYMVTGTSGSGCTNTATITVTVNPLPTVVANSTSSSVCMGDMVTLTGSGATSYTWNNSVMDGVAFTPTATTTYMVTGTGANGCTNTATVTVTVNPLPTVVANSTASSVCMGDMVTLTGSGATTYTWDNSVMNGVAFAPTSTTTYMVTGIDVNGCTNTATTTVAVNAIPVVNLGPDVTQCGGTVILDAQNAGSTYLWSDATTSMTDTISTTGNYSVVVTNANGCVSSDTVMVTFDATLVVNLGQDITQCGGSVMLDAQNIGSTYLWNDATTFQINTVSMSGIYYVDVTTASGCTGSDTVMVTIYTPPTVTGSAAASIVCVNDASIALTGSPAGGTWTGPGVTGSMFNPSAAGVGSQSVGYSFTDANGCESSAIVTILVSACTGVVETSLINGVSVYPNPTSGAFTINVNANVGNMQIEMTDLQGKIVYSSLENNVNAGFAKQISIENLANGIYMLKLTTATEQNTIKVTVQK